MPLTREEAESMIDAIKRVDRGCPSCVDGLCERLSKLNLGWEWKLKVPKELSEFDFEMDDDGHPVIVVTQQKPTKESEKTNG